MQIKHLNHWYWQICKAIFKNNQKKLGSFTETRSNGTPVAVANFIYTGNNLTGINTETRISFN